MNWQGLFFIVVGAGLAYMGYKLWRNNPQAFNKAALSKSITTLGLLTLLLMLVVAICVYFLRS